MSNELSDENKSVSDENKSVSDENKSGSDENRSLSEKDTALIESLVKNYAIGIGLSLLGLNLAVGAGTIFAFWKTTFSSAKSEYGAKLTLIEQQFQTELANLKAEWASEKASLQTQLQKDVDSRFDFKYVKDRLTDVTITAGSLEALARTASEKATKSAAAANETAKMATSAARDAQTLADSALQDAKETAQKVAETLETIKGTSNEEITRSLAVLVELMSKDDQTPLSAWEDRFAEFSRKFDFFEFSDDGSVTIDGDLHVKKAVTVDGSDGVETRGVKILDGPLQFTSYYEKNGLRPNVVIRPDYYFASSNLRGCLVVRRYEDLSGYENDLVKEKSSNGKIVADNARHTWFFNVRNAGQELIRFQPGEYPGF